MFSFRSTTSTSRSGSWRRAVVLPFVVGAAVVLASLALAVGGDDDSVRKAHLKPEAHIPGLFAAFWQSFAMILVSEMGDETFIIAAVMAMRNPKGTIFIGAMSALAIMTVISTALGVVVPSLLSPALTKKLATLLYTIFGFRLMWIAYNRYVDWCIDDLHDFY